MFFIVFLKCNQAESSGLEHPVSLTMDMSCQCLHSQRTPDNSSIVLKHFETVQSCTICTWKGSPGLKSGGTTTSTVSPAWRDTWPPDTARTQREMRKLTRVFAVFSLQHTTTIASLTIWRHCEDIQGISRHLGSNGLQVDLDFSWSSLCQNASEKILGRNEWIKTMPFWENCCRVKICEGLAWPLKTSPTGSFRRLHLTNTGVFHQPVQTFCKACDMSVLALFWIMALAVTACKKAFKPSSSWKPCPSAAQYKRDIANALRIVGETQFFEKWKSLGWQNNAKYSGPQLVAANKTQIHFEAKGKVHSTLTQSCPETAGFSSAFTNDMCTYFIMCPSCPWSKKTDPIGHPCCVYQGCTQLERTHRAEPRLCIWRSKMDRYSLWYDVQACQWSTTLWMAVESCFRDCRKHGQEGSLRMPGQLEMQNR